MDNRYIIDLDTFKLNIYSYISSNIGTPPLVLQRIFQPQFCIVAEMRTFQVPANFTNIKI